jgi:hypothetical protein
VSLNTFQKNFLFVIASIIIIGIIAGGGYYGYIIVKEKREAARIADIEKRVQRVMDLSICGTLSDTEKDRLERVKSNPTETKNVLAQIHRERANFWSNKITEYKDREDYLNQSGGPDRYWDYNAAIEQLHKDKTTAIEQMLSYLAAASKIEKHDPSSPFESQDKKKGATKA